VAEWAKSPLQLAAVCCGKLCSAWGGVIVWDQWGGGGACIALLSVTNGCNGRKLLRAWSGLAQPLADAFGVL
jgi:hypothetical protein